MSKVVCGIDIDGSSALIVTLSGTRSSHSQVATKFTKVELKDHNNQSEVQSFKQTILSHLLNEGVELVGIKGRATKGQYSGGPVSFKIEGLIQTIEIQVVIVHPVTINSTFRKNPVEIGSRNLFKYQIDAYKLAYHLLGD